MIIYHLIRVSKFATLGDTIIKAPHTLLIYSTMVIELMRTINNVTTKSKAAKKDILKIKITI